MKFQVYFRTSRSFGKNCLSGFDEFICLESLLKSFSKSEIYIIIDNGRDDQEKYYKDNGFKYEVTSLGNCKSFVYQVKLAEQSDADVIYFVESDHYHLEKQKEYILDGLDHFDVVSLYDHPDKYHSEMYNNLLVKLYSGKYCHWRTTPSTVMTFAFKKENLLKIKPFITDPLYVGEHLRAPEDHMMFLNMWKNNISLGTCLPGRSTHLEQKDISPYVDWKIYI